jgi:hypothetical protein
MQQDAEIQYFLFALLGIAVDIYILFDEVSRMCFSRHSAANDIVTTEMNDYNPSVV